MTKIIRIQSRICVGGPAYHTIYLAHGLKEPEYQTLLVGGNNNSDEKSMLPLADELGVPYKIIKEMGREVKLFDDLISLYKLYRLIKKEKPDIVHTHTAKAGTIGRIAARLAGVKKIYHTFHGHVFEGYFNPTVSRFYVLVERILARISTAIIAISAKQKFDLVERYRIAPAAKVVEIPLGFDWTFFNTPSYYNLRSRFHVEADKYLIAIIGRIVPVKDHNLFLDVAFRLLDLDPERFHFLIIGDGDLKAGLQERIKAKNHTGAFTFTGWLELNKEVYEDLDLLLLTSLNEGTPVTIIESLIAGTPVVAVNVGGVEDIMKDWDSSYLVKDRDAEILSNKIWNLSTKRVRVDKEVSDKIMSKYSIARLVSDINHLYKL